ncbi:MAG: hypothetical protein KA275_07920, partial [Chitinophagaceae bacterium]|nr:hypothetical protein [Chitinophagaceae bacterium]
DNTYESKSEKDDKAIFEYLMQLHVNSNITSRIKLSIFSYFSFTNSDLLDSQQWSEFASYYPLTPTTREDDNILSYGVTFFYNLNRKKKD